MNNCILDLFENILDDIIDINKKYISLLRKLSKNLINDKNNLITINKNQDKNDIKFYNAIFDDATNYLQKSIIVRQKKLNKDFIKHFKLINKNISEYIEIKHISKEDFISLFESYIDEENQNKYAWVKDDKVHEINEWIKDFQNLYLYHNYIYSSINNILDTNLNFFLNYNNERKDLSGNIF